MVVAPTRYTNIHVGRPQIEEDYVTEEVTPQACRLRDRTYAAPLTVDVEYVRGRDKVLKSGVFVGRMPLMLRSDRCAFSTGLSAKGSSGGPK